MHEALNTLYITTQPSYARLDHDTIVVEGKMDKSRFQMPLLHLKSIVCFGNVALSSALIHRCAKDGRSIVLLDWAGHFAARIEGPMSGNVLLRQAQYQVRDDGQKV